MGKNKIDDGGPAYPCAEYSTYTDTYPGLAPTQKTKVKHHSGMSLRDKFAMTASEEDINIIINKMSPFEIEEFIKDNIDPDYVKRDSMSFTEDIELRDEYKEYLRTYARYQHADAMLKARKAT